jgi:hypothetical protein
MAVTAEDLIAPEGELEAALFPAGDLQSRVAAYLADAQGRIASVAPAQQDDAVTAWVHYRAYTAVARRLAVEPEQAKVDDESRTYNRKQVEYFQELATAARSQFERLTSAPPAPDQQRRRYPGSSSVSTEAVW